MRGGELLATVAADGAEDVAGEALRVHADEHVVAAPPLALHERECSRSSIRLRYPIS
jgi:hypothetical protein